MADRVGAVEVAFLSGGGRMGALMRTHEWTSTPLGAPETWPQSLRSTLSACLNSPMLGTILWGPDLIMLYNDAYIPSMADRHPSALGRPVAEVWGETWAQVAAPFHHAMATGEGFSQTGVELPMIRRGKPEITYWNFTAAPIRGEDGGIAGLLNQGVETTEQVLAERHVTEERERFRRLFEQAPTFMAMLQGPDHRIDLVNPGYSRLIGHRQVLGKTVAEALPDAVEQGYLDLLDGVYRSGEAFSAVGSKFAVQAVPDGPLDERFVDFVYQPIRNADGVVTGVFVEGVDVTARTRSEAALREHDTRNRQILNSLTDYAIVATDLDGRVTRWNEGAVQVLGWTEDEMLGQPLDRFFTPEDQATDRVRHEMRSARETGRGADQRWHLKKDGSRFWASGAMVPLKSDADLLNGYVKVLRDQTGDRRREQRLALLAQIAAGLLDAADPDAVLGPVLEQSTDLLGFDESYSYVLTPDCEHLHLTHSVGASEEVRASLVKASFDLPICGIVAQTLQPLIIDNLLQTTEPRYEVGRQCGYDAFAAFPVLAGGKLHGVMSFAARSRSAFDREALTFFDTLARYVAVVRARLDSEAALRESAETLEQRVEDRTTELRAAEEALRQSQKMEAVGQLTGGLAHDFNNLLTGISGSLEMIQTRLNQGRLNDLDRYSAAAQGAAKRAAALTHRLLAFSRRQTLDPKPTDVARLVVDMADLIRRTVGPEITVETVNMVGLWGTLVDPNQLENALLNLCINARDAMPSGGRLTIETSNRWMDERTARQRDLPPGQYLSLCVSDTGTGMTPDVIARAFDPFFTTKPIGMGTGLGLSMIYGFARQSGGQVRIYSEVGQGTMLCIYLPRHHGLDDGSAEEAGASDMPRAEQGETVLVVDDEPTVRMLVADVLADLGYTAIEAGDGAAGLKVLQSNARIDLLVTDVGLPNGMNGRQLADAARALRAELNVLFITGYAENAALNHGHLEAGMHVLTKPFAIETLASRIKALIAR